MDANNENDRDDTPSQAGHRRRLYMAVTTVSLISLALSAAWAIYLTYWVAADAAPPTPRWLLETMWMALAFPLTVTLEDHLRRGRNQPLSAFLMSAAAGASFVTFLIS